MQILWSLFSRSTKDVISFRGNNMEGISGFFPLIVLVHRFPYQNYAELGTLLLFTPEIVKDN